ncbi:hypothetical protein PR048_001996 [Dryococelus australis]|uniref:Uncharacterized protein n=1 Tax=Dryococelus australis TaxID=614101 RepID=A0ABQ9IJ12_9NEOP|nr:hypothetical protein PR048_001996 [Dryococelus australis]
MLNPHRMPHRDDRDIVMLYGRSSEKYQVRKTVFNNIHAFKEECICRLCMLLSEGENPHHKCGKSISGNAMSGLVIGTIMRHVFSLPVKISRYSKPLLQRQVRWQYHELPI